MLINDSNKLRKVKSVSENEKKLIKNYLKNFVESWCKYTPEKSFTCSELLKVNNADWKAEPLSFLKEYYSHNGYSPEKTEKLASIDIGWILKETILEMPQKFRAKHFFRKEYFFISE